MSIQEILAITIVLAAIFAYINHRLVKWPPTIGIMALSLISSIVPVFMAGSHSVLSDKALQLAESVDFKDLLMNFMLSFLLFAGAIHIDAHKLKQEGWSVMLLATLGILISTFVIGGLVWYL
jgi:monovalent cation:H+ antiporter, CPA1 family